MEGMEVVGLGLSTIDVLLRLKDMPTWERPTPLADFRLGGGGPVGTALVAAARLGARAGFVGTAGNDEVANLKLQLLARDGVDISHVTVRPEAETQLVLVYVHEETGERIFCGTRRAFANPLHPDELDRAYITSAQCLHLDGFHADAALQAARWMHEAGKKVVLDAGKTKGDLYPGLRELVKLTDVLICGWGFAPALTGKTDVWEAGRAALELGPSVVVQTDGANGSYTVTAEEEFHTPAFPVHVVDTTGAGDVFHGAYIVGLLRGWDLRRVAVFASAVSAIKCTRLGGRSVPRYGEVLAFLAERGIEL